ncbi:hypothetical protein MIR68_008101 [Amoeboaphelidium protococcarum]|nr:hypothetical protein MIR68_008101 [Amoeboaphelidium protococcarum]
MGFILPDNKDPSRDWNPLDSFWKVFYPAMNPRPDASPSKIQPPTPIYDLPSPYGKINHPDNKDNLPYYVTPDYFTKLSSHPKYSVIHHNPPLWMIAQNISMKDVAVNGTLGTASGPLILYAINRYKRHVPLNAYQWFAAVVVGASYGYTKCYQAAESRLQGYAENAQDVQYWTQRAEYERNVLSGEIDPRKELTWWQSLMERLLGPKQFDPLKLEQQYLSSSSSSSSLQSQGDQKMEGK